MVSFRQRGPNAMWSGKFIQRWFRAEIAIGVTAALLGVLLLWRPSGLYLWLKAFHVIAVIAWMAGMLYLPRLFVYHCEAEVGSKQSETFKIMERRLLKAIINPAMILTWLLGLYLAWAGHWYSSPGFRQNSFWCWCCPACTAFCPATLRISPRTGIPEAINSIELSTRYPQS